MESLFMESHTVKVSTQPVDLNTGANSGARVDMSKSQRVAFLIVADAGTTPNSHTVSLQQHDAASGGTSAALSIDNPYFHKVGVATEFTKVVPGAEASSFDIDAVVADGKFVAVFEVLQEDLADGNTHVSCNVTDAGGAQIGCVIAIGHGMRNLPAYEVALQSQLKTQTIKCGSLVLPYLFATMNKHKTKGKEMSKKKKAEREQMVQEQRE